MAEETLISKPLFKNIQGLRGIAALMVCTFHFRFVLPDPWADILFGNGYIGVQIFFMISGFIMVYTTGSIKSEYSRNSLRFFLKRLLRIAPIYYISTFLLIADDLNDGYLAENTGYLIKSLLFFPMMTNTTGPYYGMPVLAVGWTLNYEMLFYILFTIAILLGRFRYLFLYFIFALFSVGLPVLTGAGFTFSYSFWHEYPVAFFNFLSNPIWLHFIFGITAGLIIPKITIKRSFARNLLYFSSVLFILYLTRILNLEVNALNDLLFCGMLFISFLINDFAPGGFQSKSFMVKLGDMSYSLYLFHHLTLAYFQFFCYKTGLTWFTLSPHSFIPTVVITLVVCWFIYKYVEKPINTKSRLLLKSI